MTLTPEQYRKLRKQSDKKLDKLEGSRTENKYGAKGQYYGGKFYDSTGERDYAMELDFRKKAKEIKDWVGQKKIELKVNGQLIANYYCDFQIEHNDGSIELV